MLTAKIEIDLRICIIWFCMKKRLFWNFAIYEDWSSNILWAQTAQLEGLNHTLNVLPKHQWLGKSSIVGFNIGHREWIIYPIDPNGETLVFDSLFCISQHMWGITICLKFKPKYEKGKKERNKHTFTRSFSTIGCCVTAAIFWENPVLVQIRNHYFYFLVQNYTI